MAQTNNNSMDTKASLESRDVLNDKGIDRYLRKANKLKIRQLCQLVHELNSYRVAIEEQSELVLSSQRKLSTSKSNYHRLFNMAPFSYMVMSRIGLIEEVNQAFVKMLATPRAALINKPFLEYSSPESRDIFHDHVRKVLKEKSQHTCTLRLINGGKDSLHVQLSTIYTKQKDRQTICLLSSLMDITKQRESELSLTQYCSRLEDMVKKCTGELNLIKKNHNE